MLEAMDDGGACIIATMISRAQAAIAQQSGGSIH